MKKIIFIAFLMIFVSDFALSQIVKPRNHRSQSRIEKLEQLKLIESLDLDEEATLKFFARRSTHQKTMRDLQFQAEDKMIEIEETLKTENFSNTQLKILIEDYSAIERSILNERIKFISSLDDILSTAQIAKLMIFERKFKQELKDVIIRERQRRK
jgi:hypothetical protein